MDTLIIRKAGGYRTGENFLFPPPKIAKKVFKRRGRTYSKPMTNEPFNPCLTETMGEYCKKGLNLG